VAGRLGRDHRAFSEINVTPFVDVMLVLLIIFMVTAPMLQQGIDVDLPDTTTQPLRLHEEPLVLTVKRDGTYFLANAQLPLEELQPKLEAIFEGLDRKEVYLRADEQAPYGVVVKAMAAARLAGAKTVGIVTEPE
jgi:biopolymer transport protein TolR